MAALALPLARSYNSAGGPESPYAMPKSVCGGGGMDQELSNRYAPPWPGPTPDSVENKGCASAVLLLLSCGGVSGGRGSQPRASASQMGISGAPVAGSGTTAAPPEALVIGGVIITGLSSLGRFLDRNQRSAADMFLCFSLSRSSWSVFRPRKAFSKM